MVNKNLCSQEPLPKILWAGLGRFVQISFRDQGGGRQPSGINYMQQKTKNLCHILRAQHSGKPVTVSGMCRVDE